MINPWCMPEGYDSRSVCLSVTKLAALYMYLILGWKEGVVRLLAAIFTNENV